MDAGLLSITANQSTEPPNESFDLMDKDQFWQIIHPLQKSLFGFAIRMLKDRDWAEDALQDVLEKLWRIRDQLDPERNPKSLAMTMMRNKCIDLMKKNGRYVGEGQVPVMAVESGLEHKDMIAQLRARMELLSTQQRMIVELKDFQGFSYEEISEITEMSINTLRVNLSRARKKLTEPLRNDWR